MEMGTEFLRSKAAVVSYHVNKALWQADNAGAFRRKPDAWRLVLIRFNPGAHMEFTADENATITEDQTFCMHRLRAFDVEEEVRWDGRVDSLGLTKYVIDVERPASVAAEAALSAFDRVAHRLALVVAGAFGARLLIANHVNSEVATESVRAEGQRMVGVLPTTTKVGFLEVYFDHPRWGSPVLGGFYKNGGLRDPGFAHVDVLMVEEQCSLDTRAPADRGQDRETAAGSA